MIKELEALWENMQSRIASNISTIEYTTIKQALQRLEAIDNANPSEALELVDKMANYILLDEEYGFIDEKEKQAIIKDRDTIKQALLKAQKEHNSVNLLMQELDCKDFADLRKYARCGYEKINKKDLHLERVEYIHDLCVCKSFNQRTKFR